MPVWSCRTCAVEHPDTDAPPSPTCAICGDERQYVRPSGQRWTTLVELQTEGHRGRLEEVEPGLTGIVVEPQVGIGQRALLVQTPDGNVLWDPVGYLDDDLVAAVRDVGGVAAVAASHPHMFGAQVEWSRRFDDARHEFERVVDLAPTNDYALFCLGRALLVLGRAPEARRPLALAARMRPDRSDYRIYRDRARAATRSD